MQCAILGFERCDEDAIWGSGEEGTPGGLGGVERPPGKQLGGSQRHYTI